MSANENQEEYNEAQAEVQKKELLMDSSCISDMENGTSSTQRKFVF